MRGYRVAEGARIVGKTVLEAEQLMPEQDFGHLLPIPVLVTGTELVHEIRITKPELDVTRASALKKLANGNQPVKVAGVAVGEALTNEGDLLSLVHSVVVA